VYSKLLVCFEVFFRAKVQSISTLKKNSSLILPYILNKLTKFSIVCYFVLNGSLSESGESFFEESRIFFSGNGLFKLNEN
jgi:hypothetical protein